MIRVVALYIATPAVFLFTRRIPAIPAPRVLTAYCLYMLLSDPTFDRRELWNSGAFGKYALSVLGMFAQGAAGVSGGALSFSARDL